MEISKIKESKGGVWVSYEKDEKYKIIFVSNLKQSYILSKSGVFDKVKDVSNQKEVVKALEKVDKDWRIDIAIAGVIDWEGITLNGKKAPCTEENLKAVFEFDTDRMLFIYKRVTSASFFISGNLGEDDSKN